MKRGQSEVITTVLIILLVLAAVFIVYTAVRAMVKGGAEKMDTSPTDISLKASKINATDFSNISISRGAGEGEIVAIKIILKDATGATKTITKNTSDCIPAELETKTCDITADIQIIGTDFVPVSYEVYPVLKTGIIGIPAIHNDASPSPSSPVCVASVPPAEVCDGLDNDCDNQIDEGCLCSDNPSAPYDNYDNDKNACLNYGYAINEKWCNGADMNQDGVVNGTDLALFGKEEDREDCSFGNNWCNGADFNQNGGVDIPGFGDWLTIYGYVKLVCTSGNNWCDGADMTGDGKVDKDDLGIFASNYDRTDCGINNSWCNLSDITRDGKVDKDDLGILSSKYEGNIVVPYYGCNNEIDYDCYPVFSCSGTSKNSCEANAGCLWFNPEINCNSFFMNAVWNPEDLLAGNSFDRTGSISHYSNGTKLFEASDYLSVVRLNNQFALNTSGDFNVHRYERVVVKDLPPVSNWGGKIYVNLKDLVFTGGMFAPLDVVFLGAYRDGYDTYRDLGIAAYLDKDLKAAIYIKAFYHDVYGNAAPLQRFYLNENEITNCSNGLWMTRCLPDRWITIEWFISNSELYGRVDNGKWRKIPTGGMITSFSRVDLGWVSSYDGGSVYIRSLRLYNESCIPEWAK